MPNRLHRYSVDFIDRERAKEHVRTEPVVFAEVMSEGMGEQSLEVHVMRPTVDGLYEVERDDTGPVAGETVQALVARIAAAQRCRYATIYPAEDRWPPPWASSTQPAGKTAQDR
jgi:hypothetical protein